MLRVTWIVVKTSNVEFIFKLHTSLCSLRKVTVCAYDREECVRERVFRKSVHFLAICKQVVKGSVLREPTSMN